METSETSKEEWLNVIVDIAWVSVMYFTVNRVNEPT